MISLFTTRGYVRHDSHNRSSTKATFRPLRRAHHSGWPQNYRRRMAGRVPAYPPRKNARHGIGHKFQQNRRRLHQRTLLHGRYRLPRRLLRLDQPPGGRKLSVPYRRQIRTQCRSWLRFQPPITRTLSTIFPRRRSGRKSFRIRRQHTRRAHGN